MLASGTLLTICDRTVAITPFVARKMDFAEVKKVCHETVVNAIDAMWDAGVSKPFRFIYVSGSGTPRKPEDKAVMFEEYSRMRVSPIPVPELTGSTVACSRN